MGGLIGLFLLGMSLLSLAQMGGGPNAKKLDNKYLAAGPSNGQTRTEP